MIICLEIVGAEAVLVSFECIFLRLCPLITIHNVVSQLKASGSTEIHCMDRLFALATASMRLSPSLPFVALLRVCIGLVPKIQQNEELYRKGYHGSPVEAKTSLDLQNVARQRCSGLGPGCSC